MTQAYPLYDELLKRAEQQTGKAIDVKQICTTINSLGQNMPAEEASIHYHDIAALILHHELLANKGVLLSNVPYEGKTINGGRGIIHYVINLPPILQHIIAQYLEDPMCV